MNIEQYLLIKLMEECAEVQQACSKALRFGLDNSCPVSGMTNRLHIEDEVTDMACVVAAMEAMSILPIATTEKQVTAKSLRIMEYMDISRGLGTLE
jgi:hypothetical protein